MGRPIASLGPGENLHQRTLRTDCEGLRDCLLPEAPVILYACLTGGGEDNLTQDLSRTFQRPVIAPVHHWLMQTALPVSRRTPELAIDSRGRLTVARDLFGLYYKPRLRKNRDRNLIAPLAMDALCRGDGYLVRSSRFRPLFRRYHP